MDHLRLAISNGMITRDEVIARLHRHIKKDGRMNESLSQCWRWTGCLNPRGYTWITICSKSFQGHRVSWWIHNDMPAMGSLDVVRHKCDNPICCNPDHLEIGTTFDNVMDAYERGLRTDGEKHPRAKYSDDDIRFMILLREDGYTCAEIADLYDSTSNYISRLLSGTYRKLPS